MNMEDQMLTFSSDGRILTYKIKVDGVHLHASSMLRVPRSDSDVNQMTITSVGSMYPWDICIAFIR